MNTRPSTNNKPAVKSFRQGKDGDGHLSIEASGDGRVWAAAIVGLDQKAVDQQLEKLKKAGAQIARPAK